MSTPIKLFIFDAAWVSWEGGIPVTAQYIAKKYKLNFNKVWQNLDANFKHSWVNNLPSYSGFAKTAKEFNLPISGKELEEIHLKMHKANKATLEYANSLRKRGYKVIILSNNFKRYVDAFKKNFKLVKYFDAIYNSQELGLNKDKPEIFEYILNKYGVKPGEAIYIDDLEKGLPLPKSLGINVIQFNSIRQTKKEIDNLLRKIKLIVLDFHGVLVKGDYTNVCKMLAKKHGVNWHSVYKILYHKYFNQAVMGKIPERSVYLNTFKEFGWKGDSWQQAHNFHKNAMRVNKQVLNFSKKLLLIGYNILLLSKNTNDQFNFYIKKFGFKRYFANIVNTININLPKASKETVEWACKEFKVEPNEVIFCDDQEANIIEPGKAGMKTILYKNFNQFKEELNNYLSF